MGDGGKGSKPRPFSVDIQQFHSNWDRIFKKSEQVPERDPVAGDQRVNNSGQLEEFDEGYWQEINNRS